MSGRPVSELLWGRMPATISIVVASAAVAIVVGIAVGIASAVWRGSGVDRWLLVLTTVGLAVPEFWLGITRYQSQRFTTYFYTTGHISQTGEVVYLVYESRQFSGRRCGRW